MNKKESFTPVIVILIFFKKANIEDVKHRLQYHGYRIEVVNDHPDNETEIQASKTTDKITEEFPFIINELKEYADVALCINTRVI